MQMEGCCVGLREIPIRVPLLNLFVSLLLFLLPLPFPLPATPRFSPDDDGDGEIQRGRGRRERAPTSTVDDIMGLCGVYSAALARCLCVKTCFFASITRLLYIHLFIASFSVSSSENIKQLFFFLFVCG